jgi:hypothetical protein
MTHKRIETDRRFSGQVAILAAKLKEHYGLDETPKLAFDESAGTIEVPDLPDIEEVVQTIDITPVEFGETQRVLTLLDKDKLTQKEDEEVKQFHRKWLKRQLTNE